MPFSEPLPKYLKVEDPQRYFKQAVAVCHCEGYHLRTLYQDLLETHQTSVRFVDESPRCVIFQPRASSSMRYDERRIWRSRSVGGDDMNLLDGPSLDLTCFVFCNGVLVLFGFPTEPAQFSAHGVRTTELVKTITSNVVLFLYKYGEGFLRPDWSVSEKWLHCFVQELPSSVFDPEGGRPRFEDDCIFFRSQTAEEQLSVAYALAQSTKLAVHEEAVDSFIRQISTLTILDGGKTFADARRPRIEGIVRHFPEQGAHTPMSRTARFFRYLRRVLSPSVMHYDAIEDTETRKLIGELHLRRLDVNISEDIVDVPSRFWSEDTHQPQWRRTYKGLGVDKRITVLNFRFEQLAEVFDFVTHCRRESEKHEKIQYRYDAAFVLDDYRGPGSRRGQDCASEPVRALIADLWLNTSHASSAQRRTE
ncbi:MAG: hypothetical protein KVP17_000591 [Porospora cf. gigantea B]|uniref:uncharacterized protein n=1 Tax=Porospora cf. gigantea B TaxID=2853592 RepID=UPI003571DE37|nr:MAG: hypothetical protein KVP17_000591 [Porospora cf. gigantea B]